MLKLLILISVALASAGCAGYRQEEVGFVNGDARLNGTLYLPSGRGPHAAIVFVHGSGRSTRENFRFYADLFARKGVAVLIYDKRDVGSIRATELVSGADLAGDVLAAVELLKGRREIDARRIGLWGGSQGSGVAARAAAQSADVAFLISVSGGGVNYEELATYQNANRLRAQGYSEQEIRDADAAVRSLYEYVRTRKNPEAAQAALDRAWRNRWAPAVLPSRRIPTDQELATWIQWREFDRTPIADWERVTVPVLAFWGERDEVVPVKTSVERIREALDRAGNRDATVVIIAGADHDLMRRPNPENVPAPEYLEKMIDWTLKQSRPAN
jgi:uncharacterized protein